MISKAGKELDAFVKGKGSISNYEGTLFEIEAAESLEGVYKVNQKMNTKEGQSTVVDLFRKENGTNYLVEAKSGKQGKQGWTSFYKENGKQLNTYLTLAKENNSKVEYVFEGSVSDEIRNGLEKLGVGVKVITPKK